MNNNQHMHNTMTLNGKGQISVVPDLAIIRLGVQTNGESLIRIQAENAKQLDAVIQAIRQIGITDINTTQYLIDRLYDFQDGVRIDRGYSVRNIIEIRTDNMDQVGFIIDTAVTNGANIVEFVSFEVSNPDAYYRQALNMAVLDAYHKAKSISEVLNININPLPISIIENSAQPIPFSRFSAVREGTFTTPIEPGDMIIDANVTAEFTY